MNKEKAQFLVRVEPQIALDLSCGRITSRLKLSMGIWWIDSELKGWMIFVGSFEYDNTESIVKQDHIYHKIFLKEPSEASDN